MRSSPWRQSLPCQVKRADGVGQEGPLLCFLQAPSYL
jgi:hypothetical protein